MFSSQRMTCESYKYFNELIEKYCGKNNIDMNQFISNREKSLAEKRKLNKQRKKNRQSTANENEELREEVVEHENDSASDGEGEGASEGIDDGVSDGGDVDVSASEGVDEGEGGVRVDARGVRFSQFY